jgi:hypothetical protein
MSPFRALVHRHLRFHDPDPPRPSLPPLRRAPPRRKEAGLPIVFGVNYAAIRYLKEHNVVSAETAAELEEGKITDVQRPALRSSQTI